MLSNNSTALPAWMYGNPETVLERKQAYEKKHSCKGCVHAFSVQFGAETIPGCNKNRRVLKRCHFYKEIISQ